MSGFQFLQSTIDWTRWGKLVFFAVLLCGCKKEEGIKHYTVPHLETKERPAATEPVKERIVAVIVPNGTENKHGWYFFKLRGPAEKVAEQLHTFDIWVDSVRFVRLPEDPNDPSYKETAAWDTPSTWIERKPRVGDPRMAVFLIGSDVEKLDCGVSDARGSLLDNINRWRRDQLGLAEIGAGELDKLLQWRKIRGRDAFFIDLSGAGAKGGAMMPPNAKMK